MHFRTVLFVVLVSCSTSRPKRQVDPDRRLTKAECTESVDHAIALFEVDQPDAAKMMRDGRDGAIAQCEATARVRDHECLMKAKTSSELGLCPMPGGAK